MPDTAAACPKCGWARAAGRELVVTAHSNMIEHVRRGFRGSFCFLICACAATVLSACVSEHQDPGQSSSSVGGDASPDAHADSTVDANEDGSAPCEDAPGVVADDPASSCQQLPDDPTLECPAYYPRLFECADATSLKCCISPGIAGLADGPYIRCCK